MRIRKHKNSNGTILITLSTLKDENNKSINLVLKDKEYKEFEKINSKIFDDSFIENIHKKFGFSISFNKLKEELQIKQLIN